MAADVSEDLRNLAARYQEFQRQAESLRQEMNVVQASITSCDQTIVTINELKAATVGGKTAETMGPIYKPRYIPGFWKPSGGKTVETMVPIGYGSYAHAEIKNVNNIIVNLGSGFSAEKTADEAIEILNRRKEQLTKLLEQMNASLTKFAHSMQALEAEATRLQQAGQA